MVSTILLSGGVGSRTGRELPKQYCKVLGKEVISYCLESIIKANLTNELVIVYGKGYIDLLKSIIAPYRNSFNNVYLVEGGGTRQESVFNGLKKCTGEKVILHEAARPLITYDDLKKIINYGEDAVTTGIDIPFTVLKKKNGKIVEVLKREELFNVQLPQVFPLEKLLRAHKMAINDKKSFTDDSSLYFHYIGEVAVLDGSSENIKITDNKDFPIVEGIIRSRRGN